MKRILVKLMGIMTGVALFAGSFAGSGIAVMAAPDVIATVTGTVSKGTDKDVLCLYNTSEGLYKIKIDSSTDTSGCKVISVGKTVSVELTHGDDGYLHAASITGSGQNKSIAVDTENRTTVNGTVLEATTDTVMFLETKQGEMQIKIDPTTDMSGIKYIISGMKVYTSVARGDDAYMHALSISTNDVSTYTTDTNNMMNTTSENVTAAISTDSAIPEGTIAVTGIPQDNSTYDKLYLLTDSGVMYVAIDPDADTKEGFVFTAGNKLTAYVYRGDDAVMHAKKIVGKKGSSSELGTVKSTFTGTVSSASSEDTLVLITSGGTMKIKIDSNTELNGGKGIVKGKAISVSASTGSDTFWHAISITVR